MSDPASYEDVKDMIAISSETNVTVQDMVATSQTDVNVQDIAAVSSPSDVKTEDLVAWKTQLSEPKSSPTASPTYFPTYIVSYVPTTELADMEKGKSAKSTDQKEKEQKDKSNDKDDGKKKKDKQSSKDKSNGTENAPRQPYSSGRGPAVTISRPSPAANGNETIAPSVTPQKSSEVLSDVPSQLPTAEGTQAVPSSRPSQAPSQTKEDMISTSAPNGVEITTVYNLTAEIETVSGEMEEEMKNIENVSTEIKELEEDIIAANNGGSKVSISGDLSSNSKHGGSKEGKTKNKATSKVSISGAFHSSDNKDNGSNDNKSKSKTSTKVSMTGTLPSAKEKNGKNASIGENGKVSFGGRDDSDDDDDSPRKATTKISMTGTLQKRSSTNVSIGERGTYSDNSTPAPKSTSKITLSGIFPTSGAKNGNDSDSSSSSAPTYMPSYVPTAAETRYYHRPSSESKTKVSLSFSSSRGDTNQEEAPSALSDSLGFKPISYYTDTPTVSASSLEPTASITVLAPSMSPEASEKRQDKKDKKKKTPAPTSSVNTTTLEPTYYVYPTFYPTGIDPKESSSRNYESSNSSTSPTYWPTYVPTMATEGSGSRPTFGFGDASGRESNFGMIDFFSPQNDNSVNTTFSDNETSVVDFMASRPANITSDQTASEGTKQAQTNNIYEKRICPGFPLGVDPSAPKVEQVVFFTYGIETDDSKGSSMMEEVMKLEVEMLEDVATNILRCNERRLWGKKRADKPVSRVYYSKGPAVSTLSECTPSDAKSTSCAIVESAVHITVTKGREDAARLEVLSSINNRLDNGYYEKESTTYTHYLGPDVAQLTSYLKRENPSINVLSDEPSQTSHPITFYAAIATVSLAISALVFLGVVTIRNRNKRKMTGTYEPFTNSSIISSRSHDPYASQSHYVRHSSSPHSNRELHHTPELSDWRSLVGRDRF